MWVPPSHTTFTSWGLHKHAICISATLFLILYAIEEVLDHYYLCHVSSAVLLGSAAPGRPVPVLPALRLPDS